ncbi:hypothetical protein RTP6_005268 [Batrachochytrium dendrobatidis]
MAMSSLGSTDEIAPMDDFQKSSPSDDIVKDYSQNTDQTAILNDSINQLAQESHELILFFKSQVAFEAENASSSPTRQTTLSSNLVLRAQRIKTNDTLTLQFNVFCTLLMLITHTIAERGIVFDVAQHLNPVKKIIDSLVSGKGFFKDHEFHFPLFVVRLLGSLKNCVLDCAEETVLEKSSRLKLNGLSGIALGSAAVNRWQNAQQYQTRPLGGSPSQHYGPSSATTDLPASGSINSASTYAFQSPTSASTAIDLNDYHHGSPIKIDTSGSTIHASSATSPSRVSGTPTKKVNVRDTAKHFEKIEADIATSAGKMMRKRTEKHYLTPSLHGHEDSVYNEPHSGGSVHAEPMLRSKPTLYQPATKVPGQSLDYKLTMQKQKGGMNDHLLKENVQEFHDQLPNKPFILTDQKPHDSEVPSFQKNESESPFGRSSQVTVANHADLNVLSTGTSTPPKVESFKQVPELMPVAVKSLSTTTSPNTFESSKITVSLPIKVSLNMADTLHGSEPQKAPILLPGSMRAAAPIFPSKPTTMAEPTVFESHSDLEHHEPIQPVQDDAIPLNPVIDNTELGIVEEDDQSYHNSVNTQNSEYPNENEQSSQVTGFDIGTSNSDFLTISRNDRSYSRSLESSKNSNIVVQNTNRSSLAQGIKDQTIVKLYDQADDSQDKSVMDIIFESNLLGNPSDQKESETAGSEKNQIDDEPKLENSTVKLDNQSQGVDTYTHDDITETSLPTFQHLASADNLKNNQSEEDVFQQEAIDQLPLREKTNETNTNRRVRQSRFLMADFDVTEIDVASEETKNELLALQSELFSFMSVPSSDGSRLVENTEMLHFDALAPLSSQPAPLTSPPRVNKNTKPTFKSKSPSGPQPPLLDSKQPIVDTPQPLESLQILRRANEQLAKNRQCRQQSIIAENHKSMHNFTAMFSVLKNTDNEKYAESEKVSKESSKAVSLGQSKKKDLPGNVSPSKPNITFNTRAKDENKVLADSPQFDRLCDDPSFISRTKTLNQERTRGSDSAEMLNQKQAPIGSKVAKSTQLGTVLHSGDEHYCNDREQGASKQGTSDTNSNRSIVHGISMFIKPISHDMSLMSNINQILGAYNTDSDNASVPLTLDSIVQYQTAERKDTVREDMLVANIHTASAENAVGGYSRMSASQKRSSLISKSIDSSPTRTTPTDQKEDDYCEESSDNLVYVPLKVDATNMISNPDMPEFSDSHMQPDANKFTHHEPTSKVIVACMSINDAKSLCIPVFNQSDHTFDREDLPGPVFTTKVPPGIPDYGVDAESMRLLLIPLNGMLELTMINLSMPNRFGRNNSTEHPHFKAFGTLVVSRNHMELFERDGHVYIRDIGSNSGTFRNHARISAPGVISPDVELHTGDNVQLGKDYVGDGVEVDNDGCITARRRCVQFQVVLVPPLTTVKEAIENQGIPIETPVLPVSKTREQRAEKSGSSKGETQVEEDSQPFKESTSHAPPVRKPLHILPPTREYAPEAGQISTDYTQKAEFVSMRELVLNSGDVDLKSPIQFTNPKTFDEPKSPKMSKADDKKLEEKHNPSSHDPLKTLAGGSGAFISPTGRNKDERRENYIFSSSVVGNKVRKLEVSSSEGANIFDINLKKWEDKGRLQISDLRLRSQNRVFGIVPLTDRSGKIPVFGTKTGNKITDISFSVVLPTGVKLGVLEFASDIKLTITQEGDAEQPDAPVVAVSGDFKESRYILVKKSMNSREQKLFGESKGRHLVRKGVRESVWLTNVDIAEAEVNPLVIAAVILIAMVV